MNMQLNCYSIRELPDGQFPSYRQVADGNVLSAVGDACLCLSRTVALHTPQSVSLNWRYLYRPGQDPQSRLSIELAVRAQERWSASLVALVEGSSLGQYYALQKAPALQPPWDAWGCSCDVVRRQDIVEPVHRNNPLVPPVYCVCEPFQARRDNDYTKLDRVLDRLDEPVLVDIAVEPFDTRALRAADTRDLARLHSINHPHAWREQNAQAEEDPFADTPRRDRHPVELDPLWESEPVAENVLRRRRQAHESLAEPHLRFHLRVFSVSAPVATLVASTLAESAFDNGFYRLFPTEKKDPLFKQMIRAASEYRVMGFPTHPLVLKEHAKCYAGLEELAHVAPVEELSGACRLPVAMAGQPRCIRRNTDPPLVPAEDLIVLGYDRSSGSDRDSRRLARGVRVKDLCKHIFTSGTPGSGKTTAEMGMLIQVAQRDIPILVIEPAKKEYRILKTLRDCPDPAARALASKLQIFTAGVDTVSPFRLNPLEHPSAVSADEHIDNILPCFQAAMAMSGSIPALLGEGLELVYHEKTSPPPVLADLCPALERVLAGKSYSADVKSDLHSAMVTRLGALVRRLAGRIFQCGASVPSIDQILRGWTVLELEVLSPQQNSLLTLFLLTMIREHVKLTPHTGDQPRLVIVLEEAHNLVGHSSSEAQASESNPDPKAFSTAYVCTMLAELRALGVTVMVVDQTPSELASAVIKLTTTKLAFRQTDVPDRDTLAATMLFCPTDYQDIARLRPGEAYLFAQDYHSACPIRTPDLTKELGIPGPPSNQTLRQMIATEPWFLEAGLARGHDELDRLATAMDRYDQVKVRLHQQIKGILRQHACDCGRPHVPHASAPATRPDASLRLLAALKPRLWAAFHHLERGPYRYLRGEPLASDPASLPAEFAEQAAALEASRAALVDRFEKVIKPQARQLSELLDRVIQRLQTGFQPQEQPHEQETA